MPNLHGLFDGLPGANWLEVMATLGVIAAAWRSFRLLDFNRGLAVALLGGFLIGRHAYALDTIMLLPTLLTIAAYARARAVRGLAAFLLSPVFYLSVSLPHPFSYGGQIALVGLFLATVGARNHRSAKGDAFDPGISRLGRFQGNLQHVLPRVRIK